MFDCNGCAERREKLKAQFAALIQWAKNPAGAPNPSPIKTPPAPQIHARPNSSKKDISP
jgi:hypothetical protein